MYIALVVIMAIFTAMTDGVFISSRNISNLLDQTGYIAVLAIGMTLVIIIRHIDLSVGFMAGFLGAIAAIALTVVGIPVWVVIPATIILGMLGGLLTSLPVAKLGIPSFVASLAGWLIYRGLLLFATAGSGTIIIPNESFNAIGNGFIPDIVPAALGFLPDLHKLTLLLGLLTVVWFIISQLRSRKSLLAYDFEVIPKDMFFLKLVFGTALLLVITFVLAGYNGMSWTLAIMLVVVLAFDWITRNTVLGRHIYAVGGNPEAAQLSGISVKRITYIVFGIMGGLVGLAGILFTSRLQSASPTAGTLFELDAIAAAYIGGVSAAGGIGKISGSLIGALVYMSLMNGMNLLGTDISLQYVIRGAVLLVAVMFDVLTRRTKR